MYKPRLLNRIGRPLAGAAISRQTAERPCLQTSGPTDESRLRILFSQRCAFTWRVLGAAPTARFAGARCRAPRPESPRPHLGALGPRPWARAPHGPRLDGAWRRLGRRAPCGSKGQRRRGTRVAWAAGADAQPERASRARGHCALDQGHAERATVIQEPPKVNAMRTSKRRLRCRIVAWKASAARLVTCCSTIMKSEGAGTQC